MIKVAFYDTKAYDKPSFEHYGAIHDIQFRFLETKLNKDTAALAEGCDAVCVFVNDSVDADVIEQLYNCGIKLIALRSAGSNQGRKDNSGFWWQFEPRRRMGIHIFL